MPLLQKNDCIIMQEFIEAEVADNHLKILNIIMRLSIKVTTLSDICTTEGRSIYNASGMDLNK